MQILENSVLGLRSARLLFEAPSRDVSLTLFPMVHVAEPGFYAQVFDEAYKADIILTEGINTSVVRRLTRVYRFMATQRSGLVLQSSADPKSAPDRTRRADLPPEEFVALWKKLPLWQRTLASVASPLVGLRNRWGLNRRKLARNLEMDDLPDRQTRLSWSPVTQAFDTAILHARDARLLEVLTEEVARAPNGDSLAVVYGAQLKVDEGEDKEEDLAAITGRLSRAFPEKKAEVHLLHKFSSPDEYFYEVRFSSQASEE